MPGSSLRIGTRDSQLAVWQASRVQSHLKEKGFSSELVYIKSEGDTDLVTPLYAMGVQGVFTRSLDAALLANRIDIAVHSMKDVPVELAKGIVQACVLPRASHKDILVYKGKTDYLEDASSEAVIATSSIRRKAQWLNRYPLHRIENLRGNVNTRLHKLQTHSWNGAIFAAAGLERIGLRPDHSIDLDWMLPAPAQGAILAVCRENDVHVMDACRLLNDEISEICTRVERDFLKTLQGGCSVPISALAKMENGQIHFTGNIVSPDGKQKAVVEKTDAIKEAGNLGSRMAGEMLESGGRRILESMELKKESR